MVFDEFHNLCSIPVLALFFADLWHRTRLHFGNPLISNPIFFAIVFSMFFWKVFPCISNQNGTHKSAAAPFFFRYLLILFRRGCFVRFRGSLWLCFGALLAPHWSFWVSFLINFELFYYENLHFRHPSLWSTCRTTAHTLVEIIPPLQGHSTRPTAMLPFRSRICQASAEQTQTPPSEENFLANPP